MASISIAVTVLNEREDIEDLIASLFEQTLTPEVVVVVDGGSTDGTWEWLCNARLRYSALIAMRDESCSLKHSPGPIARGRNAAIRATATKVVACADCGCIYAPEWLENLARPILDGRAAYSVGGSWIDPQTATLWDVASAPFFGVKLTATQPTKSCSARSMAFSRDLWQRVGGFPERVFLGEDTLFDADARKSVTPWFAEHAKALYRPHHGFRSSVRQLASYAVADGVLGVRPARLARNLLRCVAEVSGLGALRFSVVPLILVVGLEIYFAFRLDWRAIRRQKVNVLAARLLFSLLVPWVVTWNQLAGTVGKRHAANRQNAGRI